MSRELLLKSGAFLLSFNARDSKFDDTIHLLSAWFSKENNDFAKEAYRKIEILEKVHQKRVKIISPLSSLNLFEWLFEHSNDEGESISHAEFEVNLFKACLSLNQQSTKYEKHIGERLEGIEKEQKLAAISLMQSYNTSDFTNYEMEDVLIGQYMKAVYFFEFAGSNPKVAPHLQVFLEYFKTPDWKEFLKSYMPLVLSILSKEKEAQLTIRIEQNENFEKSCSFIEKLSLTEDTSLAEYDFLSLRSNPFFKVGDGEYMVIFDLFVIEKMFKGLYFFFNSINDTFTAPQKISSFRGFYCDSFSEQQLLYSTIKDCFPKNWKHFPGEKLKQNGMVGEPDYYLRNGNKVFLFESKDVLIKAEAKHSQDIRILLPALKDKFYYTEKNGTRQKKAVLQLIENVKKVLDEKIPNDQEYKAQNVRIFPILVTHDRQYNTIGLNKIVNDWFQVELNNIRAEGYDVSKVHKITIIDIDTLVVHQDVFRSRRNGLLFEQLLEGYEKFTTYDFKKKFIDEEAVKEHIKRTLLPFSHFVKVQVDKLKARRMPKKFEEFGLKLFNEL